MNIRPHLNALTVLRPIRLAWISITLILRKKRSTFLGLWIGDGAWNELNERLLNALCFVRIAIGRITGLDPSFEEQFSLRPSVLSSLPIGWIFYFCGILICNICCALS